MLSAHDESIGLGTLRAVPVTASEVDAEQVLRMAWRKLPPAHRTLLEAIGASQWQVVSELLGTAADNLLRSAGQQGLTRAAQARLDQALGAWIAELRVVLVNEAHPEIAGLNSQALEAFIARIAWHEWGHALSLARCSPEDVAAGSRLLELAPDGIGEGIRTAGYRAKDYTHELVAETYALLMARRLRGHLGKPAWLDNEIYSLLTRVIGWSD